MLQAKKKIMLHVVAGSGLAHHPSLGSSHRRACRRIVSLLLASLGFSWLLLASLRFSPLLFRSLLPQVHVLPGLMLTPGGGDFVLVHPLYRG